MTLGASAIAHPLNISDANLLHFPSLVMLGSLAIVILLASFKGYLGKTAGGILVTIYPLFVIAVLAT